MEFFRSRSFRRRKRDPKSRPLDQVVNPPAPIPPSKAENSEIEKKATNVAKQLIQPRRSFPGRGLFGKSSRVLKFPKTERPPVPSIVQAGPIAPSSKSEAPQVSKVTIGPGPKQALQRGRSKSAPGQLEKTSGSKIPTLKQTGGRRYTLSHQVPTPRGVKVSRPCLPRSALKFGQIPKKTTNRSPPPTRLKEQSIPTPPRSSTRKDEPLPILQLTPVEIGAASNVQPSQSLALDEILASYAYTTTGLLRDQSCPFDNLLTGRNPLRDDRMSRNLGCSSWNNEALTDEIVPFAIKGCSSFYSTSDLVGLGLKLGNEAPWSAPATSSEFRLTDRSQSYEARCGFPIRHDTIDEEGVDEYELTSFDWPLPPRLLIDGRRNELRRLKAIEYWSPQSPPSTCESRHVLRFGEDDQCNSVDSQHDLRVFYRNQDVEVVPLASTTIADLALNAARFSPVANSNTSKLDRI